MPNQAGLALLRRGLAQRLNYWGGDIQTNGPGVFTTDGTANTAVDQTRVEPDDEWNESWIVVNPGSVDQVGAPTIWRRIAAEAGWVQSSGIFQIQGTWPSSIVNGPVAGTSYELFKVFRPENWLQAINWALTRSYPERHQQVSFEIPQDHASRIVQWGNLVKSLVVTNPLTPPVVTEVTDGLGFYQPGIYTFAYTYYNNLGETKISPTALVTFVGVNSSVQFNSLSPIPATALGVNYYSSVVPGDTQLGQLEIGTGVILQPSLPGVLAGSNLDGVVPQVTFGDPHSGFGSFPSPYNTTDVNVQQLHHVLQRINPGAFPEIWNDLGSDLYTPMGAGTMMLMFQPQGARSLRLLCSAIVPALSSETDVSEEPVELIFAGAESYLWSLLSKTSAIVNTNWQQLAKEALLTYENLKGDYTQDLPRDIAYRPLIRVQY